MRPKENQKRLPKNIEEPIPAIILGRVVRRTVVRLFHHAARSKLFAHGYALFALVMLFGTTLLWATLGARLQGQNADQLSDPYLFSSWATFRGAFFPGAHTLLLKWPVFWLLNVVGLDAHSLVAATVSLVMVTVATLAFILYKIDRRPLVFGTVCLGLSLALLLVPAQPYAGALLPVNMAMLTTRNIEYAVYMAALVLFACARRVLAWSFLGGVLLLTVLIASDKLFLSLSLGGALLALVVYALWRAWNLVTFAARWLAGTIAAAALAAALLAGISARHVTHIVNGGSANPYGLAIGFKHLVLGTAYAVLGFLTNLGANPVYDNLVARRLPDELKARLLSWSGPAYVVALLSFLYVLPLVWRVARQVPRGNPRATIPVANKLALALLWSTVAALGVFAATNHYYPVDARYLTISLFALAVTTTVGLRTHKLPRPERFLAVGCVLAAAGVIAALTAVQVADRQTAALSGLSGRNSAIAATLRQHRTSLLVGDYWRVLPIKLAMHGSLNTLPLAICTQPTDALTSSVWQPDLHTTKFAYLLTLSGSITNFPNCTIKEVIATYGKPNATQVIAGQVANPAEAILFYDRGSRLKAATVAAAKPTTILPIAPDELMGTSCSGPTIMNVVAHQDDDILFMNPDILHELQAGDCVRTAYLTAGNDGQGRLYWISRQLGAEAAYDSMLGGKHVWVQRTVRLADDEYVTVANPSGNTKVSLIFFNLPDGNLGGEGFSMNKFESLAKLRAGTIPTMHAVDGQSAYTASQLVKAVAQLMELYRPAIVQTQADLTTGHDPDHSDHITTSLFTQAAAAVYNQETFIGQTSIPLRRYIGYPMQNYAPNVSGEDLARKSQAFFAYGRFDGGTCTAASDCQDTAYHLYLSRQYQE